MSTELVNLESSISNFPPISEPTSEIQKTDEPQKSPVRKLPAHPKRHRGGRNGGAYPIPISQLIELKSRNLSSSEIARIVGCTPANVINRLAVEGLVFDKSHVEHVRKATADTLTLKRHQVLEHLTEAKLAKAPAKDLAFVFRELHQAERLELGKSTANVSYAQMLVADQGEEERLKAIEAEVLSRETL